MTAPPQILAIDPGPEESGYVLLGGDRIWYSGVLPNSVLLVRLHSRSHSVDVLAIEMVASYGMPVGREVFQTCVWVGRFQQAWRSPEEVRLVPRLAVKLHLCQSARAKDPNVWQALVDRLGPVGSKAQPGPLYGVKSHARAALALAVTVSDGLIVDGVLRPARSA